MNRDAPALRVRARVMLPEFITRSVTDRTRRSGTGNPDLVVIHSARLPRNGASVKLPQSDMVCLVRLLLHRGEF